MSGCMSKLKRFPLIMYRFNEFHHGAQWYDFDATKNHPNWDVAKQKDRSLEHLVQRTCEFVFFGLNPCAISPNAMIDLPKTNNQQLTKRLFLSRIDGIGDMVWNLTGF